MPASQAANLTPSTAGSPETTWACAFTLEWNPARGFWDDHAGCAPNRAIPTLHLLVRLASIDSSPMSFEDGNPYEAVICDEGTCVSHGTGQALYLVDLIASRALDPVPVDVRAAFDRELDILRDMAASPAHIVPFAWVSALWFRGRLRGYLSGYTYVGPGGPLYFWIALDDALGVVLRDDLFE